MALLGKLALSSAVLLAGERALELSSEKSKVRVEAVAALKGAEVSGSVHLVQERYTSNTEISVDVSGLQPNSKHGLSIKSGSSVEDPGLTFNPFAKNHGSPWSVERKVGDLGNITADTEGKCQSSVSDPYVKLSGPFTVIGKVIAVHEHPDDLGFGRKEHSLVDGGVGSIISSGSIQ